MISPYRFIDLTDAQKHSRRILLDRYGVYAQLSALIPICVFLLCKLAKWVAIERQRQRDYTAVPTSPVLKKLRENGNGKLATVWRRVGWWLEGDVGENWGTRGIWIAGIAWGAWCLFLSFNETGEDYLHATKRFGEIAIAQFPMHYLLSMKSRYSPLALALNASHEELNPWHRLSGRIIYGLLALHASWYLNYFIAVGVLTKRLTSLDVIIGLTAFTGLTVIVTTSLASVRRWSYRVFFLFHLFVGISILPLLFFHAKQLRIYVIESLTIFVFDIVCRKLDTTTGYATITQVPHTKLIKLRIPVPPSKLKRFHAAPGQHVYLSIPPESTPPYAGSFSIHDLLFNPFTVADVSANHITLVLRALNGPTTKNLEYLAALTKARPPINVEGPLGSSRHFANLARDFDRVLLIAGGVGATFTLPIYRHLQEQIESEARSAERVSFVWSMRSSAEANWAIEPEASIKLDDDPNVKIYLTGAGNVPADGVASGSVEMSDMSRGDGVVKATGGRHRPDIGTIVDEVFREGSEERVAVLVCGPEALAKDVRRRVGRWVRKGRDVWFHDESFGW